MKNVSDLIDNAKISFYNTKIKEADQKELFKLSNNLLYKQKELPLPLYDSAHDLATRFNTFFIQKILNIRSDLQAMLLQLPATTDAVLSTVPDFNTNNRPPMLSEFMPSSVDEIRKIINCTKTTTCALDPIPTKLMKACLEVLLPAITRIVNLSLSEGVMPTSLKKAIVLPLLKKMNLLLDILKHYRPVSNLSYLSKVIERVVAKRMISHMDLNHLHELLQSAYKALHSCETALIRVHNDVLRAIDRGQCVMLILLDLSAAFDTVDHERLLQVLSDRIGLSGTALKWLKSYLSERIQAVRIDGIESEIWKILFGVPQGSVLGPILFIIYTSPLGDILRRHGVSFHCYADDTQIYLSFNVDNSDSAIKTMENCIQDVRHWMATNFLRLNDDKTEFIILGTPHMLNKLPPLHLTVGSDTISPSTSARNIGALFDNNLSMTCHISHLCRGAWHQLRQIGTIRQFLNSSSTATLMHSFVSSRLDNYNSLLYGAPKHHLMRIQRVQNAAARVVTKSKKYDHVTPLLRELHWLPIEQRITYKILLMTFKALHDKAPKYIQDLISVSVKERDLRSNNQLLLEVPKCRLSTYGCRSFSYSAPMLWNRLPEKCRKASTLTGFKSLLKTHLFKVAFDV